MSIAGDENEGGSTGELVLNDTQTVIEKGRRVVWIAAAFVLFLSRIGCMAFTCVPSRLLSLDLVFFYIPPGAKIAPSHVGSF